MSENVYIAEERETNTGVSKVTLVTPKQKSARDMRKFVAKFGNITKSFSVSKFGYDEAFGLACHWAKFGELESFKTRN